MHTEVFDKILIHFAIQHYNGSLTLQMLFIIFIKTFRPGCRQIELPRTSGMVLQFSRVISYLPLSAVIFNTVANLLCDNINVLANQDHAYRLKSTSGGRGVRVIIFQFTDATLVGNSRQFCAIRLTTFSNGQS